MKNAARSIVRKQIVTSISRSLAPVGFEKDGHIWFRRCEGFLQLLSLDPDRYGFGTLGISIGVFITDLPTPTHIKLSKKGIPPEGLGSWDALAKPLSRQDELLFSLESNVEADARDRGIRDLFETLLLPWLNSFDRRIVTYQDPIVYKSLRLKKRFGGNE